MGAAAPQSPQRSQTSGTGGTGQSRAPSAQDGAVTGWDSFWQTGASVIPLLQSWTPVSCHTRFDGHVLGQSSWDIDLHRVVPAHTWCHRKTQPAAAPLGWCTGAQPRPHRRCETTGTGFGTAQAAYPPLAATQRCPSWPWLTWNSQDRWGDVGLLIDTDVVAKPVDLHRLGRAHSLAREVEWTVLGDVHLLGLTDEVWEPCTDASREARDSASSAAPHYRQPQTGLPRAVPSSSNEPLPIPGTAASSWSPGLSLSWGAMLHTSSLSTLVLTFQLHQDRIRYHLPARDAEFADVGAVI